MDFFKRLLKPVKILAPMVGHSDFAWRALARRYGADICYTEMVHSNIFLETNADPLCNRWFITNNSDRPLVVQLCGNSPEIMLKAAKKLQGNCDAIDINLGCPQNIAKKGHYGSFLQDNWELVGNIVSFLSSNLEVPLFCKIRIFESIEKTVKYAKMIEASGCSLIAVHGRLREQKGQSTGFASWKHIKAVKEALKIPVIANGNIVEYGDIESCVAFTKCDGVMVAETHLHNPLIFSGVSSSPISIFSEYIDKCASIGKRNQVPYIKSHFFKVFHKIFETLPHFRKEVSKCSIIEDYRDLLCKIVAEVEVLGEAEKKTLMLLHPRIRGERLDASTFMAS